MKFASELQAVLAVSLGRPKVRAGDGTGDLGSAHGFWTDSRPGIGFEGFTDVCACKSRKCREAYIFR